MFDWALDLDIDEHPPPLTPLSDTAQITIEKLTIIVIWCLTDQTVQCSTVQFSTIQIRAVHCIAVHSPKVLTESHTNLPVVSEHSVVLSVLYHRVRAPQSFFFKSLSFKNCDTWYVTCEAWGEVRSSSSLREGFMNILREKMTDWLKWVNGNSVCGTSPASWGLLNSMAPPVNPMISFKTLYYRCV